MHPFFNDAKSFVLDTLFPVYCLVCNEEGVFLCSTCLSGLAKLEKQRCVICEKASLLGFTHPRCGSPQMPDAVISLFDYRDKRVSKAIIFGKYYFIRSLYIELAETFSRYLKSEFPGNFFSDFILVPIPLARQRQRWRGYNQSEVVAGELSKSLGLATEDILLRGKNTRTQKDLDKEARKRNVHNAFILKADAEVMGKNFIIVDDVVTTGSTLIEAAKVLKRNGANKVWCLTLARD